MNKKELLKALHDELYMPKDSKNIYLSVTAQNPNYQIIKDFIEKGCEEHDGD